MSVAERTKVMRTHFQLTMQKLASVIGVSQAQISQWETGKNTMPQATAMAFQAALGVRWQWLLHGEGQMLLDDMGTLSENEVRLLTVFRQCDAEARADIMDQADFQLGRSLRRADRGK